MGTHDGPRPRALGATGRLCGRTAAQWYCLVAGILLAVRGAQQLIVGASFAMPGDGWRASQQLLAGTLLLLAGRNRVAAYRVLIPFAIFYSLLSVVGDTNGHEAFGLLPVDGRDLFAHPLYAVVALLILARGARKQAVTAQRAGEKQA